MSDESRLASGTGSRWLSLAACALLATFAWALLEHLFRLIASPVISYLGTFPPALLISALTLFLIAFCWPLGRGRWPAFFGIRHFIAYPPLWVSIALTLVAITAYTLVVSGTPPITRALAAALPLAASILFVSTTFYAATMIRPYVFKATHTSRSTLSTARSAHDALVDWISTDHEITGYRDDRFRHTEVALRIAYRIHNAPHDRPTIAVIGPAGSGKSSIRNLVAQALQQDPSIHFIHLSLWPFESTQTAVSGILSAILRTLHDQVNTLSLTGVSESYLTTIERVGGRWAPLARLFAGDSRPHAVVAHLAEVASTIGISLVLWIEDLERFSGSDHVDAKHDISVARERLRPIHALLHLLDQCPSISVITADTSLRSQIDIDKIARYIESPPRLSAKEIWQELHTLRSAAFDDAFIDPATTTHRKTLTPPSTDNEMTIWFMRVRDTHPRVPEAIALLVDTPRAFKSVLRIIWETWNRLRGEIDFDSVLAISVLRVARPHIFALIEQNIDAFREGFRDPFEGLDPRKSRHPVLIDFESLLDSEHNATLQNAITAVVSFVFPAALREQTSDRDHIACPQGLHVNRHVDNWRRYLSLPLIDEATSDQAALRSIVAWKDGGKSDLIDRLMDEHKAEQIKTFIGQFRAHHLCQLLFQSTTRLLAPPTLSYDTEHAPPNIIAIWHMMHLMQPPFDLLADTLISLLNQLVFCNFSLSRHIYYYYAHREEKSSVPSLLDDDRRAKVQGAIRDSLTKGIRSNGQSFLVEASRNGHPADLWFLCRVASAANRREEAFERWSGVSTTLLDLTEADAPKGIPLLLPFVTTSQLLTPLRQGATFDEGPPARERIARFDEASARRLFDFERLVAILRKTSSLKEMDEEMGVHFIAAKKGAQDVKISGDTV